MKGNDEKTAQYLEQVCSKIKCTKIHAEIKEELESHIEENKSQFIKNGMSKEEAEDAAVAQMGDANEVGLKLNKIHSPRTEWSVAAISAALFIIGIFMYVSSYLSSPFFNINELILYMSVILFGTAAFFVIYFADLKKITQYSFPAFISLSLLMDIFAVSFGIGFHGQNFLIMTCIFLPAILALSALVYQKKNDSKALMLLFIPVLIDGAILFLTGGIIWSAILMLVFPAAVVISGKRSGQKRKAGDAAFIASVILLCVVAAYFCYLIIMTVMYQYGSIVKLFGGGNKFRLFGKADTNNYGFIMLGFGIRNTLKDYGIIITVLIVSAIVALIARIGRSAFKIKDGFYRYMSVLIFMIFAVEIFTGLLNEAGLFVGGELCSCSTMPFLSGSITYFPLNMMLLAVFMSCYRRKDITPEIETVE